MAVEVNLEHITQGIVATSCQKLEFLSTVCTLCPKLDSASLMSRDRQVLPLLFSLCQHVNIEMNMPPFDKPTITTTKNGSHNTRIVPYYM